MSDLYALLGLNRTATRRQIRDAFRRISKKFHPDVGGNHERFQEMERAARVLSDDARRARYDATGEIDESAEGAAEGAVNGMIGATLQHILAGDEYQNLRQGNVQSWMLTNLTQRRQAAQKQIDGLQRVLDRVEVMRGRWSGRECLVEDMLTAQVDNLNEGMRKGAEHVALVDRAIEKVRGWTYRVDESPDPWALSLRKYDDYRGQTSSMFR